MTPSPPSTPYRGRHRCSDNNHSSTNGLKRDNNQGSSCSSRSTAGHSLGALTGGCSSSNNINNPCCQARVFPRRLSSLHQVTTSTSGHSPFSSSPQQNQSPDASPMTPSINVPTMAGTGAAFSGAGSGFGAARRRNLFRRSGAGSFSAQSGTSPTLFCGNSARSSLLGFEAKNYEDDEDHDDSTNNDRNHFNAISNTDRHSSSEPSSDDDDDFMNGYDSDDRMSVVSRRASLCSNNRHPYSPLLEPSIKGKIAQRLEADRLSLSRAAGSSSTSDSNCNLPSTNENILDPVNANSNIILKNESGKTSQQQQQHNLTNMSPGQQLPRVSVRQLNSSVRSLKPKVKSFLRISKELQEEMAPLDYEVRREAEVTNCFRQEAKAFRPSLFNEQGQQKHHEKELKEASASRSDSASEPDRGRGSSSFAAESDTGRRSMETIFAFDEEENGQAAPTTPVNSYSQNHRVHPNYELLTRLHSIRQSSSGPHTQADNDTDITPHLKRKAGDMFDGSNSIKRRAVSPGLSPLLGESPTSIGKLASLRQMSDTSDSLQNLSL